MSVPYGYRPYYGPTGKVDFGWIGESWNIFKQSWWMWVLSAFIYMAVMIAAVIPFEFAIIGNASQISAAQNSSNPFASNPFAIFSLVPWYWIVLMYGVMIIVGLFMGASYIHMALKAVRREALTFGDAFGGIRAVGKLFVLGFLIGLVGLALSIIPWVLPKAVQMPVYILCSLLSLAFSACVYPLLMPVPAMIVDGDGPFDAVMKSIAVMKRNFGSALLFMIAVPIILYLLAVLTCGFGALIVMPMAYIICVLAYRDMIGMDGIQEPNMPYQQAFAAGPAQPGTWPPPPGQQPMYGQMPPQQGPYAQPGGQQYPPQPPYQQPPPPAPQQPPYQQPPPPPPYGQQPPENPGHGT